MKDSNRFAWVGIAALAILVGVHVALGSSEWIPFPKLLSALLGQSDDEVLSKIVFGLRLPRVVLCVTTGAILGMTGTAFQAIFRNPLAEPHIVGATTGAAIGAALSIIFGFGTAAFGMFQALAATGTGLAAVAVVMALSKRRGVTETPTLLLAGVVVSSLLGALLSLCLLLSGQDQGRVLRWLLGSLSEARWSTNWLLTAVGAFGFVFISKASRALNVVATGDESAFSVGVNPYRLRALVIVCGTIMVASLVGAVGVIGFVGLVAPHISRRLVGSDLRKLVPQSTIIGSALIVAADIFAQRGVNGTEYPIGIITALLGAPSLLILIRRDR